MSNPYAKIDVGSLLEKLGINARRIGDGKRLTAKCPVHSDRRASWFIRDQPGEPYHAAHKCQGCGFGGGPIALVAAVRSLDEDGAREWLRGEIPTPPIPVEVTLDIQGGERRGSFELPSVVRPGLPGEFGRYYLERSRKAGVSDEVALAQVEIWGIGHVEPGALNEDGEPHRLRRRIFLPVRDRLGRLRSYTARAVARNAYLRYVEPRSDEHPPEDAFFGEACWDGRGSTLVVVEGPFDLLAVEAAFWPEPPAVAALRGSNPLPTDGLKFSEFSRVIVMTDADKAGRRALASLEGMLGRHVEVRGVTLPDGQDPAEVGVSWLRERLGGMIRE